MPTLDSFKMCRGCGNLLPLSSFYKHSRMKDGYLNHCKICKRLSSKKHREENEEYYKQYRINYERDYVKESLYNRKRRVLEPHKYKARVAVGNALRDGKLIKLPCEVCGGVENVQGHHVDYDKPLEVVWLCPKHHTEVHNGD